MSKYFSEINQQKCIGFKFINLVLMILFLALLTACTIQGSEPIPSSDTNMESQTPAVANVPAIQTPEPTETGTPTPDAAATQAAAEAQQQQAAEATAQAEEETANAAAAQQAAETAAAAEATEAAQPQFEAGLPASAEEAQRIPEGISGFSSVYHDLQNTLRQYVIDKNLVPTTINVESGNEAVAIESCDVTLLSTNREFVVGFYMWSLDGVDVPVWAVAIPDPQANGGFNILFIATDEEYMQAIQNDYYVSSGGLLQQVISASGARIRICDNIDRGAVANGNPNPAVLTQLLDTLGSRFSDYAGWLFAPSATDDERLTYLHEIWLIQQEKRVPLPAASFSGN
jgi:hypothetical protein